MTPKQLARLVRDEHNEKGAALFSTAGDQVLDTTGLYLYCYEDHVQVRGQELTAADVGAALHANASGRKMRHKTSVVWSMYLQESDLSLTGVGVLLTRTEVVRWPHIAKRCLPLFDDSVVEVA